jgi:hypothetical protein
MEKADDQQALNIMGGLWQELNHNVIKIEGVFEQEGVVIPNGFTKEDVNLELSFTTMDLILCFFVF